MLSFHLFYCPKVRLEIADLWPENQVRWGYLEFNQSMKTRFDQAINSARALLVLLPKIIEQESQLSQLPCDRGSLLKAFYCCTRIDTDSVAVGCPTYYNPYIVGELDGNLLIKNLHKCFRETDYQNGFVRIIGELFVKKTELPIEAYFLAHRNNNGLIVRGFFDEEPTVFGVPDFSVIDRSEHLQKIHNYLSQEFDELGEEEFIEKYLNDFRAWLDFQKKK